MAKPYKVFGVGLNKTGTSSLKIALRRLGYRHCRRQGRLARAYFTGDLATVFLESDTYESFEDWPWPLMYRELYERYGDSARYILTTRRSPEVWVESLKSHARLTQSGGIIRKNVYGYRYPHGVEAEHIACYQSHNAAVHKYFAAQNASHLLIEVCWEQGQGWREICDFLGEPIPETTFPHANRARESRHNAEVVAMNDKRIARQLRRLKDQ